VVSFPPVSPPLLLSYCYFKVSELLPVLELNLRSPKYAVGVLSVQRRSLINANKMVMNGEYVGIRNMWLCLRATHRIASNCTETVTEILSRFKS